MKIKKRIIQPENFFELVKQSIVAQFEAFCLGYRMELSNKMKIASNISELLKLEREQHYKEACSYPLFVLAGVKVIESEIELDKEIKQLITDATDAFPTYTFIYDNDCKDFEVTRRQRIVKVNPVELVYFEPFMNFANYLFNLETIKYIDKLIPKYKVKQILSDSTIYKLYEGVGKPLGDESETWKSRFFDNDIKIDKTFPNIEEKAKPNSNKRLLVSMLGLIDDKNKEHGFLEQDFDKFALNKFGLKSFRQNYKSNYYSDVRNRHTKWVELEKMI